MPIFGHHCIRGQERERSCSDSAKCHLNHDFSRTFEGLPQALQLVCEIVFRILLGHFYISPPHWIVTLFWIRRDKVFL